MLQLLRYNWKLAFAALVTVVTWRLLLWFVPFRWLRRWVVPGVDGFAAHANLARRRRIAVAVRIVSRSIPGATCLTQSLSTIALLKFKGDAVPLQLGVARSKDGVFKAHAWLESEGKVLIGDLPDLSRYQRLQKSVFTS